MRASLPATFLLGVVAGFTAAALARPDSARAQSQAALPAAVTAPDEIAALRSLLPPQGHAMADVESHFVSLWFAGTKQNWALADFYYNQTLSNLRWAVRIRPKRPTKAGEIDLQSILDALETSALKDLKQAIGRKSSKAFAAAYETTLSACQSCHQATERSFLKLKIPETPRGGLVDFEVASSVDGRDE
jgi:hypothetical protein